MPIRRIQDHLWRVRTTAAMAASAVLLVSACGGAENPPTQGSADPSATRMVEHELGTTAVPVDVERIVTVDSGETMAHLLALDREPPLAAGSYFPQSDDPWPGFPDDMAEELRSAVEVFDRTAPPIERIAALDPDLIIGPAFYVEEVYDQLSQVAPTVATNEFGENGGWEVALVQVGEALGQRADAEAVVAGFQDQVAAVAETIEDAVTTVSVVSLRPESVRIWREDLSEAALIADLGVELTPTADDFDGSLLNPELTDRIDVGEELIPEIDGAAIVLRQDLQGDEATVVDRIRSGPLWQALPAVESGNVLVVGTYTFTGGVFGYRDFIDEVASFLEGSASGPGDAGS